MHDGGARLHVGGGGGGSYVEWDYADLSLVEVHPATLCAVRGGTERKGWSGRAWQQKKVVQGLKERRRGWMEMSGRVDNEEERAGKMTGETENWLKMCLYMLVRVCYQRL